MGRRGQRADPTVTTPAAERPLRGGLSALVRLVRLRYGRGVTIRDNPDAGRYEALVDDELAGSLFYRERGGALVIVHTELEEGYEGQGVGGRLVAGALDDVRSRGLSVIPLCPFTRSYIERHPEYQDLVVTWAR